MYSCLANVMQEAIVTPTGGFLFLAKMPYFLIVNCRPSIAVVFGFTQM